jgi:hypothetical protein
MIARAREREKAGDTQAAAGLLAGWLELNPGATGSPRVFAAYFTLEQDYNSLLAACLRFVSSAKGVPGAGIQLTRIARLFEMSGRTGEARDAYVAAWEEGGPPSTLVSSFLLSLEMNDASAMQRDLMRLKGRGGDQETLLAALADLGSGREPAARSALVGLADQTRDAELAVRALWVLYEYSVATGDVAGQASARKKLAARFPGSPETAIAASSLNDTKTPSRVLLAPRPAALARTGEADTGAPSPTPSTDTGRYGVQAGSFQMKENADDLALELQKRGFVPTVTLESANGKDRYRVFAGTGLGMDAARALLDRLSEEGYSGFVVAEKR